MSFSGIGRTIHIFSSRVRFFPIPSAWRYLGARTLYAQLEAEAFVKADGVFLRDIINERMEAGDARLQ